MIYIDTKFSDDYRYLSINSHNIRTFQPRDMKEQQGKTTTRYHYTSAGALMDILNTEGKERGSVRFTDSRYMNDRSEHLFFVKRLLEFMEKNRKNYPFCQSVINELLLKEHSVQDYISLRVPEIEGTERDSFLYTNPRHYIFCLSRERDSLHMWNYYTRNGNYQGYNLGIKIYDFLKYFDNNDYSERTNPIRFYCGDVLYMPKKQEEEIETLCKTIEELGAKMTGEKYSLQLAMGHLWAYIECYGLFYKDKSFSDEKEYRIVIQFEEPLAGATIHSYFRSKDHGIEYSFFERNGILVPCLCVPLSKTAIKNITMAPMMESHIASASMKEYLMSNGYNNVEVMESSIPIRY